MTTFSQMLCFFLMRISAFKNISLGDYNVHYDELNSHAGGIKKFLSFRNSKGLYLNADRFRPDY